MVRWVKLHKNLEPLLSYAKLMCVSLSKYNLLYPYRMFNVQV